MTEKKRFVEPEMVKYQESLDKVTLNFGNGYGDHDCKPVRRKIHKHGRKVGWFR